MFACKIWGLISDSKQVVVEKPAGKLIEIFVLPFSSFVGFKMPVKKSKTEFKVTNNFFFFKLSYSLFNLK